MSEHKSLAEALAAFQAEAPTLAKDGRNPHFNSRFTPLDTIVETIRPLLAQHGLAWSALPCFHDGQPALRYELCHAATGQVLGDTMPLLMQKSDPQGMGSAITYARRYSLAAVLNLVSDEDDDGNSASKAPQARSQQTNGKSDAVTPQDIKRLQDGAKGLKIAQIKLAFTACGLSTPDPFTFNKVPKAKAPILFEALAGMERE